MALSVVDLYKNVLPKTNCGDCGFPTCLAFASMVVSEKKAPTNPSGPRPACFSTKALPITWTSNRFSF